MPIQSPDADTMHRITRISISAVGGAALAWLGGCRAGGVLLHPFEPEQWHVRTVLDDPVYVPVTRSVAVDATTFNGNVEISVNPRLATAVVTVRREAVHGTRRSKESKESLDEIQYTAQAVAGDVGQVLQVRATTNYAEPHFLRAHLKIEVPALRDVTVRTGLGNVNVVDANGRIHIDSGGGDVMVMTNLALASPVTIATSDGDIDFRIPGGSAGAFECEAYEGTIDHGVRAGRFIVHRLTGDTMQATLNDGTSPMRLRTVGGNVRLTVGPHPTDVGAFVVDP